MAQQQQPLHEWMAILARSWTRLRAISVVYLPSLMELQSARDYPCVEASERERDAGEHNSSKNLYFRFILLQLWMDLTTPSLLMPECSPMAARCRNGLSSGKPPQHYARHIMLRLARGARCSEATCMALCRDMADACESASEDSARSRRLLDPRRTARGTC